MTYPVDVMRRAVCVTAVLLAVSSFADEVNLPAGTKPRPMKFAAKVTTEHYVVEAEKEEEFARRMAAAAEGLHADFFATFRGKLALSDPRYPLAIVCLDSEESAVKADYKVGYTLPGRYDPLLGLVTILRHPVMMNLDQNPSNLRHEVTHQLVHQTLGLPPVDGTGVFWMQEGLASYFEGMGPYGLEGIVRFSKLGVLTENFRVRPLPRLAEVTSWNWDQAKAGGITASYALAWGATHFLMHGEKGAYRDLYFAFLTALRNDDNLTRAADLFRRIFAGAENLEGDWARHIHLLEKGTEADFAAGLVRYERSAPAGPGVPANVKPFVKKTAGPAAPKAADPAVRRDMEKRIGDIRKKSESDRPALIREAFGKTGGEIPALLAILKSGGVEERKIAAAALGAIGAREAVPNLAEAALRDADRAVRLAAASALRGANYGIAPPAVFAALGASDPAVILRATEALGEIGDPYAAEALVSVLRRTIPTDPAGDAGVRVEKRSAGGRISFGTGESPDLGLKPSKRSVPDPAVEVRARGMEEFRRAVIAALKRIVKEPVGDSIEDWLIWDKKRSSGKGSEEWLKWKRDQEGGKKP
ncbi:MAG: HEAT repeat domain-containing protein [Planctomycetota bacterium]